MSPIQNAKLRGTSSVGHWRVLGLLLLAVLVGCGEAPTAPPTRGGSSGSGGTGGSVGSGGAGGSSGSGGMLGSGGSTGSGGSAGSGGIAGSAGTGGSGGSAGIGGTAGTGAECVTNALCPICPSSSLCNTGDDCAFSGSVCIASGCATHGGDPIKQCVPAWAGSCSSVTDCPNPTDYECAQVGAGGKRCIRVTPGCNPATETYDCAPGFSCENGACVDRRVPCDSYEDCPRSHICITTPTSKYCTRVSRTCHINEDCSWLGNALGSFCADVDGDGVDECTGERDSTGEACVSSDCGGSSVCESGAVGSAASCGDYGLCRFNSDCGSGFECVGLWQDGRKECVPTGGTCDQVTDCDPQQVCAAPRTGNNAPSCQSGSAP
jgi:hypothetical protein